MARFIAFLLAFVALALPALADDSHHDDELSEHAFETAERIFRLAAQDDPRCAMAH